MTVRSTKRVNGDYDVYANTVTIWGNLDIIGTTTTVETSNTYIKDNMITLNSGEDGSTITSGISGIEVDRGPGQDKPSLVYSESLGTWALSEDSITYLPISSGVTLSGNDTEVIYNVDGISFGANANFAYDYANNYLTVSNITIKNGNIETVNTDQDLVLNPNGNGVISIGTSLMLEQLGSDPSSVSANTHVYAKTPAGGATGVYFVNTADSGELVSKKRAKFFAWIF